MGEVYEGLVVSLSTGMYFIERHASYGACAAVAQKGRPSGLLGRWVRVTVDKKNDTDTGKKSGRKKGRRNGNNETDSYKVEVIDDLFETTTETDDKLPEVLVDLKFDHFADIVGYYSNDFFGLVSDPGYLLDGADKNCVHKAWIKFCPNGQGARICRVGHISLPLQDGDTSREEAAVKPSSLVPDAEETSPVTELQETVGLVTKVNYHLQHFVLWTPSNRLDMLEVPFALCPQNNILEMWVECDVRGNSIEKIGGVISDPYETRSRNNCMEVRASFRNYGDVRPGLFFSDYFGVITDVYQKMGKPDEQRVWYIGWLKNVKTVQVGSLWTISDSPEIKGPMDENELSQNGFSGSYFKTPTDSTTSNIEEQSTSQQRSQASNLSASPVRASQQESINQKADDTTKEAEKFSQADKNASHSSSVEHTSSSRHGSDVPPLSNNRSFDEQSALEQSLISAPSPRLSESSSHLVDKKLTINEGFEREKTGDIKIRRHESSSRSAQSRCTETVGQLNREFNVLHKRFHGVQKFVSSCLENSSIHNAMQRVDMAACQDLMRILSNTTNQL